MARTFQRMGAEVIARERRLREQVRKLTVVGSRTMAVFDDMEAAEKIRLYDKGVDPRGAGNPPGDFLAVRSGDIRIPKIGRAHV